MSIPGNITRAHIEKAIKKIDKSGIPSGRDSKDYKLVFDGSEYPPKYVISLANKYPNKKELPPSDFFGGAESNQYLQRLGFDIYKNGKLLKVKSQWIATVILESEKTFCKTDNDERCKDILGIIYATAERTQGHGVMVFPGGFFNTGQNRAGENCSKWVKAIIKTIKDCRRNMIVCFGVDGRRMKDQLALAVSRDGCFAMGRKFHPTESEESYIQEAKDHLARENEKDRIFELAGKKYYLAVCNDVFGIHQKELENPGVDVVLNFVHQFNPRGKGHSSDPYFAIYGLAQGSKQWDCPVFASATFFRRRIKRWPTGVLWNQGEGEMEINSWKYEYNPIEPSLLFSKEIPEGKALIRLFKLRSRYERKG